jgi:hypothetical protein
MPDVLIAAISAIADEATLEETLAGCTGLETGRITLFKKQPAREAPARERLHPISPRGSSIAAATNGTSVPGMGITSSLNAYEPDTGEVDRLGSIGIPAYAAHNYNIAIEEGRSVVTYMANVRDATLVEEQFRACGFLKIRRFT